MDLPQRILWLLVAAAVLQIAIEANLAQQPLPTGTTWALLAGFIAFTSIALLRMLRRFGRTGRR